MGPGRPPEMDAGVGPEVVDVVTWPVGEWA
jgi:hypothetical protein